MSALGIGELITNIGRDADADIGLGAIGNYLANKKAKRAAQEAVDDVEEQNEEILKSISDYYANNGVTEATGGKMSVGDYVNALKAYNPDEFTYDVQDFSYGKSAEDFYNENADRILADVAKATQQTAAGAGVGRGTGAAQQIASDQVAKNEELWNDAQSAYNADRAQAYNEWSGYTQAKQNEMAQKASAYNQKVENLGAISQLYLDDAQNEFEDTLNAKIAGYQSLNSAKNNLANAGTADAGFYNFFL